MKTFFSVPVVRLAIGALLLAGSFEGLQAKEKAPPKKASTIFATSAADGGRLVIRRSPVLGDNVRVQFTIDGKKLGPLLRNRSFDRYLTPGRHVLVAWADRAQQQWTTTLDVRVGETYTYTASFNNKLVLTADK